MSRPVQKLVTYVCLIAMVASGCAPTRPFYFYEDGDLSHYKAVATEIEYPDVCTLTLDEVEGTMAPFSVHNSDASEIWDLSLQDAIYHALVNAKVMRQLGGRVDGLGTNTRGGISGVDTLLTNPDFVPTVYLPALAESDPRFGPEGALSAFDAEFTSSLFWEKRDRAQNVNPAGFGNVITAFIPPFLDQDLATFQTQIAKTSATGGQFALRNNTAYDYSNAASRLFPSAWETNIEAEFRHPLLQGAGVDFNRIAGPDAVPGLYNGVVLARIRTDIALVDFETGVRNLVSDVENQYWDLYCRYRILDAEIAGRDSALQTWRKINTLGPENKGGEKDKEAQAREQYFLFRARVEAALTDLYGTEGKLRYLMGLAATDGRLIRPCDNPVTAQIHFDWCSVHTEALARSPELRGQRWRVKQRELELVAAKNFLLPRLDLVGLYRWRGFGDELAGDSDVPFNSAWSNLADGDFQEWQVGVQLNSSIGFRQQLAAVRHAEQFIARERAVLQDQELELSHLLSNSIREVDRFYTLSQTNFNRRAAAEDQVEAFRALFDTGLVTVDLLLDAQRRQAEAETEYYVSQCQYMKAVAGVHFHKGSLLEYDNVYLAESPWPGKAYLDACEEARKRDAGTYMNYGYTRPKVISRGPIPQHLHNPWEDGSSYDLSSPDYQQQTPSGEPTPAPAPDAPINDLPEPPIPTPVPEEGTSAGLRRPERTASGEGPRLASPRTVERTSATVQFRSGQSEVVRAVNLPSGETAGNSQVFTGSEIEETPSRKGRGTVQFRSPPEGSSANNPVARHETVQDHAPAGPHRAATSWAGAER